MGRSRYVHLEDVRFLRMGDEAILVEYEDQDMWTPHSQLAEGELAKFRKAKKGEGGFTLSITAWIADKLGIEASDLD